MKLSKRQLLLAGGTLIGAGAVATAITLGGGDPQTDQDVAKYFGRWWRQPERNRVSKINEMVARLKAAGLWEKLDALWDLQSEDRIAACMNLKGSEYDLQIEGTVIHRPGFGLRGDGVTGFMRTGISPDGHKGSYQLNSSSLGAVCIEQSNGSNQFLFGTLSGNIRLKARQAPAEAPSGYMNDAATPLTGEKGSGMLPGLTLITRTSADKISLFKSGRLVGNDTLPATEIKPGEIWLGRWADRFNSEVLSFAFIGGGLLDEEAIAINEIVRDYLTWSMKPIMCFGDSLTQGVRDMGKSPLAGANSYPSMLQSISGRPTINGGIGGQTSTQIRDRALADNFFNASVNVIWAGRNNYGDADQVFSDIEQIVDHLTHDRYIVVSILSGEYKVEYRGDTGYAALENINKRLKAKYQDRFVDVQSVLKRASRKTDTGDQTDISREITPRSLRSDTIHMNDNGDDIIARTIASFINEKGW